MAVLSTTEVRPAYDLIAFDNHPRRAGLWCRRRRARVDPGTDGIKPI